MAAVRAVSRVSTLRIACPAEQGRSAGL